MPDVNLGTKHECYACGVKFYDLGKPDPVCPKCGANQNEARETEHAAGSQSSRSRRKTEVKRKSPDLEEEVEALDDEEVEDEEEDLEVEEVDAAVVEEAEEEVEEEAEEEVEDEAAAAEAIPDLEVEEVEIDDEELDDDEDEEADDDEEEEEEEEDDEP